MSGYFDSGVLLKNYCPEENSPAAVALVIAEELPLFLGHLQESEIRNAIRLKVFRREITASAAQAALANFDEDIRAGRFDRQNYSIFSVFRRGEALSAHYSPTTGARLLDILHVATAMELGIKRFVSFDHRQRAVAKKAGLKVQPDV